MCLSGFYLFFFIVPLLCITPFIWVFNKGSKTGAICGAVTAYPSGAHRVHTRFLMWLRVARSLVFCVMFCRWFTFCPVSLAIVLSVLLRFTLWYPHTFGHCVVSPSSIYPLVSLNFSYKLKTSFPQLFMNTNFLRIWIGIIKNARMESLRQIHQLTHNCQYIY